jgi:catechol 2,3-dioxygenase-like lactoylglutathione lyase family enzyme
MSESALEGSNLVHVTVHSTNMEQTVSICAAACEMRVQRTDQEGGRFVGFSSGPDDFALKVISCSLNDASDDDALVGISVTVQDALSALALAVASGAEVVRPLSNHTYVASLIPDEDLDDRQPWFWRAVVRDPSSGLELELREHQPNSGRAVHVIDHVTLRISDLDDAVSFYTEKLGMKLHRKMSLVPVEPALSAFLSYAEGERESTLLELRYMYGRAYGRSKAKPSQRMTVLTVSTPSIEEASVALSCPVPSQVGSYSFDAPQPASGLRIELVDELEFLKQSIA